MGSSHRLLKMTKDKPFLATTAIEDFWDASAYVVFLGKWCKRHNRKNSWQNINCEVLASYFEEKKGCEMYCYLDTVFERLLIVLHKQMNAAHGTDFSLRYWRIILGPWLILYIHVMYDRYRSLKHFIGVYPDFSSICLDQGCFLIPKDTMYFAVHSKNDDYNLQIYSSILSWLGYRLPTKKLKISTPDVSIYLTGENKLLKKVLKYTYKLISGVLSSKDQVFLRGTYFSNSSLFKLIFKTRGTVWPCLYDYQTLPDFPIDYEKREILGRFDFGENEFEKMIATFIHNSMPQSMVEGFNFLRQRVNSELISEPKAIMSAISWWFDDIFQIWSAESGEKGIKLLGVQHGGNYGMLESHLQEDLELKAVDKYYSWGWKRDRARTEVMPMPAPKLVESKTKVFNPSNEILYPLNTYSRYLLFFPWSTDFWENYFLNQGLFLRHTSDEVRKHLRIRPHRDDLGWDAKERIAEIIPDLRFESWEVAFKDSLNNSRIFVSDHPLQSTTFIEALSSNKPTIAFYRPEFAANKLRPDAVAYFEQLKENAIIFDDPVKAADQLNLIYDSAAVWWNQPKRQEAVKNFLYRFGRTSPAWLPEWSEEVSNVIKS